MERRRCLDVVAMLARVWERGGGGGEILRWLARRRATFLCLLTISAQGDTPLEQQ